MRESTYRGFGGGGVRSISRAASPIGPSGLGAQGRIRDGTAVSKSPCDQRSRFYCPRQTTGATTDLDGAPYGGARYPVEAVMAGRTFVRFHLDVGIGDVIVDPVDTFQARDWLGFEGIEAASALTIQSEQQFAEKIHAYTLPRAGAPNSRVRPTGHA